MVDLKEYPIFVISEQFFTDRETMEVKSEGIKLPCPVTSRGCERWDGTYYWEGIGKECKLQFVRDFQSETVMPTYKIDYQFKILISTTRLAGCDDMEP